MHINQYFNFYFFDFALVLRSYYWFYIAALSLLLLIN